MGRKIVDITGKIYGKLKVLEFSYSNNGKIYWICQCECGQKKCLAGSDLKSGHTKSCGCWKNELVATSRKKHGMEGTRAYRVWDGMIQRCTNVKSKDYERYGGRGIQVCEEWKSPKLFLGWYNNNYPLNSNFTLDRIDNSGNYEPNNCRFVSNKIQANNRRDNKIIEIKNESLTLVEAMTKYGQASIPTIQYRMYTLHWTPLEAILTPPYSRGSKNV